MFPSNLHKNIQELNRQITLLETECENMQPDRKKSHLGNTPPITLPSNPFVTGPTRSNSSYSAKRCTNRRSQVSRARSTASVPSNPTGRTRQRVPSTREDSPPHQNARYEPSNQVFHRQLLITNPGETIEITVTQKSATGRQIPTEEGPGRLGNSRSMDSIREVTECSDHILKEFVGGSTCKNSPSKNPGTSRQTSLDDEFTGGTSAVTGNSCKQNSTGRKLLSLNQHSVSVDRVPMKKNWWPRLAQTKSKWENDVLLDVNPTSLLQEKEIQCMLWWEEREKEEFLLSLNESARSLRFLINKLKEKSSGLPCRDKVNSGEEKGIDIVNDMENTVVKLKKMTMRGHERDGCGASTSGRNFRSGKFTVFEGYDTVLDLKKAFVGVKEFCEELSEEKTFLSEQLALRNRTIIGLKNKEKDYLSLISRLSVNLERAKEQVEEWNRAKKEFSLLKAKLEDESKVMEALKRSHAKMQDLVENYVLENDQLKTQMRLSRLESEKFNVLLAGKEEEIKKYKQEMGSFQRQICQQLSLLRSKASENHVEKAIRASLIGREQLDPAHSETNELTERFSRDSSETSVDSSWILSQVS